MRANPLFLIPAAVAGLAATGASPAAAQCPDGTAGSVLINELQVGPADGAFIELVGAPGAAIDCLKLVATNGGSDGTTCDAYATIELPDGAVLGEDGLYLIATGGDAELVSAKADLQNGPDAVSLVHEGTGAFIDTVAYGGALDGCETPVVEGGSPAAAPANGQSIGRADGVDTNVNGKDFQPCNKPTPGAANDCPAPIPCGAEPSGELRLSELYLASGLEFVELVGTPGLNLSCFSLVQLNGGSGDQCEPTEHSLAGRTLGDGGILTVDIDLQVGPDAVQLVWKADDGSVVPVDGVAYGAVLSACPDVGKGGAAPAPKDKSISKCGAAGDDATDWVATAPTPGEANACPAPCGPSATAVVINEVVYDPDDAAFVELKGPAGLDLRCYTLVEINGGTGGVKCTEDKVVSLEGLTIPDDGYLVIAKKEMDGADSVQSFAFQNGPDMFRLRFAADAGPVIVDQLVWNGAVTGCADAGPDSGAGPKVAKGESVARCPDGADSGDAAADLGAATPTPGAANECAAGGGGGGSKTCTMPDVEPKLSEVQLSTGAEAFIELWGKAGTDLSCFAVVGYNGGSAGTDCKEYARIELTDAKIPASGYLLIAKDGTTHADLADVKSTKSDLQDGPDAVALVYLGGEQEQVVDSLVYGAELPACAAIGVGEGKFAGKPAKGRTLTRCEGYDSGDNSKDFAVCKTPSPGAITTCGCTEGQPSPPGGTTKSGSGDSGCNASPAAPGGALLLLLAGLAALRRRA